MFLSAQERPVNLPRGGVGNIPGGIQNRVGRVSGGLGGSSSDSLQRRDRSEDSITISYVLPITSQAAKLDSSIRDFTMRYPIPAHHIHLGNTGNATRSILFAPIMKSGWDHGFHGLDVYRWDIDRVRFFNTTRPYTELGYVLGSRTEQIIEVMHTQNLKPNWNILLQYRLISSPGFFKNQKSNHNNYLITSWFQSKNRRYNNYFVIVGNALQSEENGGIKNDKNYIDDPVFNDRFNIPTKLGGDAQFGTNFFNSKMNTGNRYTDLTIMMRQQFDLGRKDSIVSDSTVIPLFFPRLRFEYTALYSRYKFRFIDYADPDSTYYEDNYSITLQNNDSLNFYDQWTDIQNDFSIYQFPDAKNLQQFIKVGAFIQNLQGELQSQKRSFYNIAVHGEYRNKTKDKKWDMAAAGKLYINGLNSGDYNAFVNLKRFAGKRLAYIELGFQNTNRTPSFIFDSRSSFYLDDPKNLKKENITRLSASFFQPSFALKVSGDYFLVSNYTYITNFYKVQQEETVFNLLQLSVEKIFRLGKRWVWRSEIYFQQKAGNVALNVPLIFTRNRIGYEGNLGFKNLDIAIGVEGRYHTPYKPDNYSPLLGKFFYQDSLRISNLPDITGYVHFRIRSFKTYFRAENLNTITGKNGFGFRNNSFGVPGYPYPGLVIRLGIYWSFVN